MSLTKIEKAYIAGLFDGEGSFTITALKRKENVPYYFTEIFITNSDKGVMDWLSSRLTGSIRISRNGKRGWKDVYKFFLLRKDRKEFIENVLPHLVIKKKQAAIALELLNLMEKQRANHRGIGGLTNREWKQRHELALKIRKLNKRSVKGSPR